MIGGFHRASLSISLDFDIDKFRSGDPHVQRVYWHEKLHFFQVWSQGYIAHLALLEWQHLARFLKTGDTAAPQELTIQLDDFCHADPELGFSTWNLSEALTRFWDILIVGFDAVVRKSVRKKDMPLYVRQVRRSRPKDLDPWIMSDVEFDYLMQLEDWYARPYRFFLSRMPSRQAALLFPLAAHFALQSKSPVHVFASAVDRLLQDFEVVKRLQVTRQGSKWVMPFGHWNSLDVAVWWATLAPRVQAVCEDMAKEITGGAGLATGWDVVEGTALKSHPVYGFMLHLLDPLVHMTRDEFTSQLPDYPQIPFSTAFAIPGAPIGMALLKDTIQPPLIVFTDGIWATWLSFAASGLVKAAAAPIAGASLEIRQLQEQLDRDRALGALKGTAPKERSGSDRGHC
jgi:hypothetical protein